MTFKIGGVEKRIYSLRAEHPLVIPQFDPEHHTLDDAIKLARNLESIGVQHIAIGSSFVYPEHLQALLDIFIKDFDFTIVTYIVNTNSFLVKGKENRTAIYWATIFNAMNLFYLRDSLIQGAPLLKREHMEPLPTAYIFDERGSNGSANWLTQPNPIPYNKPEISLATALACEYLGIRFYIMAGGSGAIRPPPVSHIKKIKEKTNLFLIPTSGIKSESSLKEIFAVGADAVHIGTVLEKEGGFAKFKRFFVLSKRYPGKDFMG